MHQRGAGGSKLTPQVGVLGQQLLKAGLKGLVLLLQLLQGDKDLVKTIFHRASRLLA